MNKTSKKLSNLKLRIISGALIGAIFITAIFFVRPLFFALIIGIAGLMLSEWYSMTKTSKPYLFLGLAVITIPIISLLHISDIDKTGWVLFTFFVIIWTVDSFAMLCGKTIQGPKLAPVLSPKKTISGLVGGVLAASLAPLILAILPFYDITNYVNVSKAFLVLQSGILGIIAQVSDLFISYFKRKFKIKDSGDIIPGHGGVLDRFDSLILTAPILAIYLNNQIT